MTDITPNQWTILEMLQHGSTWARSLQTVKPLVEDLVERGLVERVRPHLGAARNVVRLTPLGCEKMGIAFESVPTTYAVPPPRSHRKRRADVSKSAAAMAAAPEPVDRDPCPRCGIRRDIGCAHLPCRLMSA